jgi:hypothetical protein
MEASYSIVDWTTLDAMLQAQRLFVEDLFTRYGIYTGPHFVGSEGRATVQSVAGALDLPVVGSLNVPNDYDWEAAALMAAAYGYPATAIHDPWEFLNFVVVARGATPEGLLYVVQCTMLADDHPALVFLHKDRRNRIRRLCCVDQYGERFVVVPGLGEIWLSCGLSENLVVGNAALALALPEIRRLTQAGGPEIAAIAALTMFAPEPILLNFSVALRRLNSQIVTRVGHYLSGVDRT